MMDRSSNYRRVTRHRPAPGQPAPRRAWLLPLLALLVAGCGASDDHPPPAPTSEGSGARLDDAQLQDYDPSTADERDSVADGSCQPGASRPCRVYLPAHDGIQPCFVGEQRCVDAQWSACSDVLLVDADNDDQAIAPVYP